jgi:glucokinase
MEASDNSDLPEVKKGLITGVDIGGTKTHIIDTESTNLHRYNTSDYSDVYAILDEYFYKIEARPERVAVAMAGPRDDATGNIKLTNLDWPVFSPKDAAERYSGTIFSTLHDMGAVAAGVVYAPGLDLIQLKKGIPANFGPKLAVTISTGVGLCVAAWNAESDKYFFFSGEGGHVGFQPYNEAEYRHLAHIFTKYDHPSVELAISGKHGVESWLEHSPELNDAPDLKNSVISAVNNNQPAGAILLENAKHGEGSNQSAAIAILDHMGTLLGNVLADYALAYRATGGIYVTGSVALGLAEYWAENTNFIKAFVRHGTADHAPWLEDMLGNMPIYLLSDPHIAVAGALAVAKRS